MPGTRLIQQFALCALLAAASFGATPVARVIGTEAIDVDGITTPARTYAPVKPGNRITTHRGAAVLQFRDGSSVAVQPNSAVAVEGTGDAPQVRIAHGTATYTLAPTSRLRIVDSRGETVNRVLENALPVNAAGSNLRERLPVDAAVMYRGSSRQPGGVAPASPIAVGQFTSGGVFRATGGTTAQVITPTGITLNLTLENGVYKVSSVTQVWTDANGVSHTVTSSSGALIGTTVGGVTTTTPGGTSVSITFTRPDGTTMTPQDARDAVRDTIRTAPGGGTAPPPSGVTSGTFSGSGN